MRRVRGVSDRSLPPDAVVVDRLRAGDEATFAALLDAWSPGMLRAARAYVADEHTAEDVVQEAWVGVLKGIHGFAARSSLRTWVYRILINTAKTRGVRDSRTIPLTSLTPVDEDFGPTVNPDRFQGAGDPYPRHWRSDPPAWPTPENEAVTTETRRQLADALAALPPRQRVVITLRDVQGYTTDEVCAILEISPANQRVLLHRARAAVRAALEEYLTTWTSA
ncbi:MAG: RNA polymerase subunit sigma-24 [Actinobacteria bacterium 13_2_20CM_2_71_6]|nr:MAG: RNA polymerase subunit sigma-24 [Actinobacteria bacterium 13_2_20CM_2_71_6]